MVLRIVPMSALSTKASASRAIMKRSFSEGTDGWSWNACGGCILNKYTVGNRQRYRCWPGNLRLGVVGAICVPA
eukprot:4311516-Pleurochrysis_carterae.AAC.3